MPPKSQPKFLQLLLKVQKQTIFVTVPLTSTIGTIKEDAFSALTDAVNQKGDIPSVSSLDDFELCKAVKDKTRSSGGEVVYAYEPLDASTNVKLANVYNWETLYLRFRDADGELAPVNVTQPSIEYEDQQDGMDQEPVASPDPKGKRKAALLLKRQHKVERLANALGQGIDLLIRRTRPSASTYTTKTSHRTAS